MAPLFDGVSSSEDCNPDPAKRNPGPRNLGRVRSPQGATAACAKASGRTSSCGGAAVVSRKSTTPLSRGGRRDRNHKSGEWYPVALRQQARTRAREESQEVL